MLTVEVLSGTGTGGQTDGAKESLKKHFHSQRHAAQKRARSMLLSRQLGH